MKRFVPGLAQERHQPDTRGEGSRPQARSGSLSRARVAADKSERPLTRRRRRMGRVRFFGFVLALVIGMAAPAFAADEQAEGHAEQHGEAHATGGGEHGGGHGHGEVHATDILGSVEFWGAVVNFGLLVFLLRKYASKPLAGFLESRRAEMEVAIREATEAKAAAEAKHAEYEARLQTLDAELKTMRRDIENAAREDKERILREADEASARLREETASIVRQSAEALERDVRREVVSAAVEAAERVLREQTRNDDQQRLADRYRESLATRPRGSA